MTKIEWADRTWNPVTGCSKISEGCRNCYAERMAKRLAGRCGYPKENPFEITVHKNRMSDPINWRKPSRIFVCSMGDLFNKTIASNIIASILSCTYGSKHTFILLTKRPIIMKSFFEQCGEWSGFVTHNGDKPFAYGGDGIVVGTTKEWPLKNIWVGVSVENQEQADKRIPILLDIPAKVRFVSVEPMLEPIDITKYLHCESCIHPSVCWCGDPKINWVVCGGETGPGARPMDETWAINLKNQCIENTVPFFFKQHGGKNKSRVLEGTKWKQFPEVSP